MLFNLIRNFKYEKLKLLTFFFFPCLHKDEPHECWRIERDINLAHLAISNPPCIATATQSLTPFQHEEPTFITSIQQEHPFVTSSPAQPCMYSSTPSPAQPL